MKATAFLLFNIEFNQMNPKCVVLANSPKELARICGGSLERNVLIDIKFFPSRTDAIRFSKDFTPQEGLNALKSMHMTKLSPVTKEKIIYFVELPLLQPIKRYS